MKGTLAGHIACVVLGLVTAGSANAIGFSFDAGHHAASATFTQQGNQLVVQLWNMSLHDTEVPSDILTGVYFNVAGSPTFTPTSALLGPGSRVLFDDQPAGGNVGGEWAFDSGLCGAPGRNRYGISATGLGLFGPWDRFPGPDLTGQDNIGGMDYGIVSAGDNPFWGNSPVTGKNPLIKDSVVFTLSGLPSNYDLNHGISNVWFQYGTSLCEPSYRYETVTEDGNQNGSTVPEPLTITGMALLIGAAGVYLRRRTAA